MNEFYNYLYIIMKKNYIKIVSEKAYEFLNETYQDKYPEASLSLQKERDD